MSRVCDKEALPTECPRSSELLRVHCLHQYWQSCAEVVWEILRNTRRFLHRETIPWAKVLVTEGRPVRQVLAAHQCDLSAKAPPPRTTATGKKTHKNTDTDSFLLSHMSITACEHERFGRQQVVARADFQCGDCNSLVRTSARHRTSFTTRLLQQRRVHCVGNLFLLVRTRTDESLRNSECVPCVVDV